MNAVLLAVRRVGRSELLRLFVPRRGPCYTSAERPPSAVPFPRAGERLDQQTSRIRSGFDCAESPQRAFAPRQMSTVLLFMLKMCRLIDAANDRIGRTAYWLVLVAAIISSGNALVRYLLNTSSNAWLEIQWYLFSCIVLLCAGYALLHNEHVRIDILSGRMSGRVRAWIDILAGLLFLLPICLVIGILSWPMFIESYVRHEVSGDAGGLLRWPVKLLIPLGFFLLAAQGVSEIVKRVAFLAGLSPDPAGKPPDREAAAPSVHSV